MKEYLALYPDDGQTPWATINTHKRTKKIKA